MFRKVIQAASDLETLPLSDDQIQDIRRDYESWSDGQEPGHQPLFLVSIHIPTRGEPDGILRLVEKDGQTFTRIFRQP